MGKTRKIGIMDGTYRNFRANIQSALSLNAKRKG
jgi:hypothetical protein